MADPITFITVFGSAFLSGATAGIVGSVAAGSLTAAVGYAVGGALAAQGLNSLNRPKKPKLGGNLSAQKSAIGSRALILGRTAVGGNLCTDLMRSGRNSGVASQVVAIGGCGPVGTIESVIWGADTLTFSGSAGSIQPVSSPSKYSGKPFWMVQKSGAWDQTYINISAGGSGLESSAQPSAWRSTDRLGGFLAAMLIYGAENPVFEQNFHIPVFVVDASAVPLIDPRTLTAATTQSQKRNPWVWAYSFALGFYSETNVKTAGIGLSASLIDATSFSNAANTADSNSWTIAGVLPSNPSSMWSDIRSIAQAGGGDVTIKAGKLSAIVSAARSSIATLTEDDLAAPPVITAAFEGSSIPNRIIPRFISEDNGWAAVDGTVVTDSAFVTAQGERKITETIDFPLCGGGGAQAGVLAAYSLVNAREPLAFVLQLKPQARYIGQSGDCITLALPNSGLSSHKVVITEITYSADLSLQIKAITETDSKHSYALGQTSTPPDYSVTTPYDVASIPQPGAGVWSRATATLSDGTISLPVINVTGSSDWSGATGIIIKVKLAASGDWLISEVISPNATAHQLRGLQPATSYIIGVAYQGLLGQEGPVRSLDAITTGAQTAGTVSNVNWSGVIDDNGTKPDDYATRNIITSSTSAPSSPSDGDIWIDTNSPVAIKTRISGVWVSGGNIPTTLFHINSTESNKLDGVATGATKNVITSGTSAPSSPANGDIWVDTNDPVTIKTRVGGAWVVGGNVPTTLSQVNSTEGTKLTGIATGATKNIIYQQVLEPTGTVGDIWIDTDDANKLYLHNGTNWVLRRDTGINDAFDAASNAQDTADEKIVTFFQSDMPTTGTIGDLWFDTDDANKLYRHDGTTFIAARDTLIGTAISNASTAQATANSKIITFFATSTPTASTTGDLWYNDTDKLLKRWNGSSWVTVSNSYENTNQLIDGAGLGITAQWPNVSGTGKPADNATVGARSGTNIYRTDGTTVLTQAEIRTAEGTAAAITGQAATATSSDFSVVTGATKPANNATVGAQSGTNLYRTDGTTVLSQAEIRTAEGTAAAIASQGALATVNSADFSTQVTGGTKPANNATVGAVSGTNLYRTDGSTVMTQAEVRTAEGTAAAITGQGALATLSTADTAQLANNATFIDNKFSVDGSINVGWGNEYEFGSVTTSVAGGTVQIFLNGDFSASSLSTGGNLELVFQRVRSGTTTDLATYVFNKSGAGNVAERPKLFISRASSVLSGDTYKVIMRVTGGTPGGASLIDTDCIITHLKR